MLAWLAESFAKGKLALLTALVPALLVAMLPASPARAQHDAVTIEGVPSVIQWYSLSCEYAAAATVTLYWMEQGHGELVSQSNFVAEVPNHPNPHVGFRGNIHGPHGGIDDYGIYAEPLVPVLERRGYSASVVYEGGPDWLKSEINEGHPIVVWITSGRYTPRPEYYHTYDNQRFKLVPYEHAVVVYGYDSDGVYSMDVGTGEFVYTEWDSFLMRWNYFDQMALRIHP